MPRVGKKHYPYTKKGKAAAAKARKKKKKGNKDRRLRQPRTHPLREVRGLCTYTLPRRISVPPPAPHQEHLIIGENNVVHTS